LRTHGTTLQHVALHADPDTIIKRINEDHTHSDTTRAFRLSKLDDYLHAYTTWLPNAAHIIDTRHITASEAANQIAKLTTSGH
ncbi:MAG: hypothetical protein ACRDTT_13595, partial [Pseudonocardiaceae bacterium]